jgi:hypothetical protein
LNREDLLLRCHPTCYIAHYSQIERALARAYSKFFNGIGNVRVNLPINFKSCFHHKPGRGGIIVIHSRVGRSEGGEDGFVEGEVIAQAVQEIPTGKGGVMLDVVMSISKKFA